MNTNKAQIIEDFFAGTPYLVRGKQYPEPLPNELAEWYCYVSDTGHAVLALIDGHYTTDAPDWQELCPVPVKTALRDYRMNGDFVAVGSVEYNDEIGLRVPEGDEEF